MNTTVRLLLGVSISSGCLWLALRNFDFQVFAKSLQNINVYWVFPALNIYISNYLFRTIRWKIILAPIKSIPVLKLFPVLTFGFFANNFLPARGGEIARAVAGAKLYKSKTSSFLGTIAVERVSDLFGLAFIILISMSVFVNEAINVNKIFFLLFIAFLCLLIFIFGSRKLTQIELNPDRKFLKKGLDLLNSFSEGFKSLQSWRDVVRVIMLALMIWLLEALTIFIFAKAFNLDLSFFQACGVLVGIAVGVSIPASPGFVGTYELFAHQSLLLMGFTSGPAMAFVLGLHLFHLIISSLLGLPLLIKFGFNPAITSKDDNYEPS